MTAVRLRAIAPEDCSALARMTALVSAHEGVPPPGATAERIREAAFGPHAVMDGWIAERGARPVGHILSCPGFDLQAGRRNRMVVGLWVDPAERRHGLARRLFAAVAAQTTREGGADLHWFVVPENAHARGFYAAIGATPETGICLNLIGAAFAALAEAGADGSAPVGG